ncbi:PBP1A family penicillin-binding protein [Pyrinomonas methylaliphatogenes]|uniref:Penicillin-binding protein, 1A family n=1 Tax=Pyrinomonas methylaliphatogenes TaxID=454194 RepID=A0A0B6X0B9_9BACT|nr:PBP1A family penicillin-binding protein [Pyrinomonas methylaliphatogenes]CDM65989.1 penicillin-binding protein, 1A family [Pyrinomonas methylaliphatogenes]
MAVGHPTKQRRRSSKARVVRYDDWAEPRREWWRRLFSAPVIAVLAVLATACLGVLAYYYVVFSARIDRLLRGEIFTRSAGIYAAPKEIRVGENLSLDDLIALLKRAGYVERGQQADSSRGRYAVEGTAVEIEPSENSVIDGQRVFARLRVQFARGGRGIASITDLDNSRRITRAWLEPEQISSVMGREREKRRVIGFKDLPPHLVKAILVTEDRSFFEHPGINFRGILRALWRRYDADPNSPLARQGGSSITQQLVKNLLLSPERTLRRKLAEAYMSLILETRLSKEEIFALYCNEVYLGQQAGFSINGFGEAAQAYFNKDVTELTLPEAAFLAGLIRSPNRYNPYRDPERATARRNQVLQSMAEAGAITPQEAAEAQATPLKVAPAKGRVDISEAPYFVDYVQNLLGDYLADMSAAQHLRIYTSIDMDLQRAAYAAVAKQLAALDRVLARRKIAPGTVQAALVALNAQTGEIVAMVGGRDYEKSQLNRVEALRQPGSVFKPFVYATALNTAYDPVPRVITAATTFMDEPKTFTFDDQEYSPGNFGDQYTYAPVTLRDALVRSLNVVTVEVANEVTIGRVMNLAAKAGLPKPARPYLAMALGTNEATPLQIASAYTAFAQNGVRVTPVAIDRITTGRGETVVAPVGQKNEVLTPEVAFIMTSMMKDVVNRGTAARLRARGFRANVAGKTGTSRDGWFAGYTPSLVCVVWVGFDDGSQLGLTGADSALPIWADFMTAALNEHPEWTGDWQMPAGIETAEIDPTTGQLAAPDSPNKRLEYFIRGTAPTVQSQAPPEASPTPEIEMPDAPPPDLPVPEASPAEPTQGAERPRLESRGLSQPDGSARSVGTITLDIDPTTGLIAAPTCPVIRSKTFIIGQEPRRYCGPQYHTGRSGALGEREPPRSDGSSRPRLIAPRGP